ncbi:MAG: isoprenoid biosynthesis glyoxalase ElbB [Candidatus Neomarinimicrobiota bacterium]
MSKVGVVLAGCGVFDGAEIQEAVITLLALDRAGVETVIMAPDIEQLHTIDHVSGDDMPAEIRNVQIESARIARGKILDINEVGSEDLDALIFPGGFGVAKNLCDYAMVGPDCDVNPDVLRLTGEMINSSKPIGAMCIAPVMLAKVLELMGQSVRLTVGNDARTAADIESMGSKHVTCTAVEIVVDEANKIVTTPAYMTAGRISEAAEGIEKLVAAVLAMI